MLRVVRRLPAPRPFAIFERDGAPPIELFDGYRDVGKARWRSFWWSTRVLLDLVDRVSLPPDVQQLVRELRAARTLPQPLEVYADAVARVADECPGALVRVGRRDERLGRELLARVRSDAEIASAAAFYERAARALARRLGGAGIDVARSAVLDAGCGSGWMAFAVAGLGAGAVHGVDLDVAGQAAPEERERMRLALAADRSVELENGDLARLGFPDASFDAVYSVSVVEHLVDVPEVFAELRRVLRPGGVAHHGIDLWHGPAGGHSLFALDAPWGHVRLGVDELERYVATLRPHELADAVAFLDHGVQRPALTLEQTVRAAREAGFEVIHRSWWSLPLEDMHRRLLTRRLFGECRRRHPAVTTRDLLSVSATLVLRRR